ncbi:redoxin domain-containing protein [Candidatus Uhrbacteria bacterium]|nr:redoxin domain-containing protein [Candidatus Uhrbacteria bacterium]
MKHKISTILILGAFGILIIAAISILAKDPVNLDIPAHNSEPMPMPIEQNNLPILREMMPEFQGLTHWWNTSNNQPLFKEDLKGKVVLIDFWTYSCINCIRTQPVLRQWWDTYKDEDFIMIGIHTPEFAFEKDPDNVERAIKKAELLYPIALDPDFQTWRAFNNRYWPAAYLFDTQGRLRYTHFGEGEYDVTEAAIRSLLDEAGADLQAPTGADATPDFSLTKTRETYFGYKRAKGFANSAEYKPDEIINYTQKQPQQNQWSLAGGWRVEDERSIAVTEGASFQMNMQSNAMHIVLGTPEPSAKMELLVDGQPPTDDMLTENTIRQGDGSVHITVREKDLYRIARFPDAGRHTVKLRMIDPNIQFYAATFGE